MNASSAVGTWGRRVAVAWLAAGLATLADRAGRSPRRRAPIAENPAWKQYVLGTGKPDAAPVRVASTSGAVTNAQGLVHPSKRPTTLTYTPGVRPPRSCSTTGARSGACRSSTSAGSRPPTGRRRCRCARRTARRSSSSGRTATPRFRSPRPPATPTSSSAAWRTSSSAGRSKVDDETATIAAVGTQSRSTTLFAAAAAGDTNIKVASTTGIAAGDTMRIDTAGATESVTVTNVGTPGPGTGITFTPALTSAHAAGAAVLGLGTGVTLTAPLASGHAAGAPVTGHARVLTGDRNGFNGVGVDPSRADTFPLSAPGHRRQRAQPDPGRPALPGDHPHVAGHRGADVRRHPLPPSERLERRLRRALPLQRRRAQPHLVPGRLHQRDQHGADRRGAQPDDPGDPRRRQARPPAVDRRPLVQGRTAFDSLGFGAKGSDYIKGTIAAFGAAQAANGSICGQIGNWTRPAAAPAGSTRRATRCTTSSTWRRTTCTRATRAFAESQYQTMKNELAYNRALVDPTSGLLDHRPGARRDWDFYDGGKLGRRDRLQRDLLQGADRRGAAWRATSPSAIRAIRLPRRGRPTRRRGRARRPTCKQRINATPVRRRAWRLQAGRPRQRRRTPGPRCRRTPTPRRSPSESRRPGRARRHPALPQEQPLGHVRAAAVLARRQLLDGHQPVRDRHGGRRPVRRRRHRRAHWR